MQTNRRTFLSAIAAALAWRPAVKAAPALPPAVEQAPPLTGVALADVPVANAIVKIVAQHALAVLRANLTMGNLVRRDFEPIIAQRGDVMNVPIPPLLIARSIAEGEVVPCQTLENAHIALNRHMASTFQVPDVEHAMRFPETLDVLMLPAIISLAESIETDLLAVGANFANVTSSVEQLVETAETALFLGNVPKREPRFLVVDSSTYGKVRKMPGFLDWKGIEPTLLTSLRSNILHGQAVDGAVGEFLVFRSHFADKALAFAKDAIGLITRRQSLPLLGTGAIGEYVETNDFGMRVTMTYSPTELCQVFTIDILYGCGILRPGFGTRNSFRSPAVPFVMRHNFDAISGETRIDAYLLC